MLYRAESSSGATPREPTQRGIARWRGPRIGPHAAAAATAAFLFICLSVWWILTDNRLPGGGDPGRHLLEAIGLSGRLQDGDLLAPLTYEPGGDFTYPPLVRSIGAIPELLGLPVHDWGPIALNLVFVPLLVAGCYLTGRLAFGRVAGLFAATFALASPMVMQLFHVQLIDAPLAAIVAIATWALLASDDFRDRRQVMLAGGLIGLATLVKTPAPLFLAGPIAVMLIRGGWRQGRNLALLAAAALTVAAPYYLVHLDQYVHLTEEAAVATSDPWTREYGAVFDGGDRFTLESFAWYSWAAINTQYLVPLLGLLIVGVISCLRQIRRRYVPELLAGLVVGYVAMTMLAVHDARYTLPLVIFVSVIATGWIATTSREWLAALAIAALVGSAAFNVVTSSLGGLGTVKMEVFESDSREIPTELIDPGTFTIIDKRGYVVGEPRANPFWKAMFAAAEEDGVDSAALVTYGTPIWGTEPAGFEAMASHYGIRGPLQAIAGERPDLVATISTSPDFYGNVREEPCAQIEEGIASPEGIADPASGDIPLDEGMPVSVLVERRREQGQLEPWCEFLGSEALATGSSDTVGR